MLPYARIASALQEISPAPRARKAELASDLLAGLEPEMLCPAVRLLLGELWPSWVPREMGVGPEAVLAALTEISEEDVLRLRRDMGEMGMVAEAALKRKSQHPLSDEPLEALSVYERLRRISRMSGSDSEHRKDAILRGLFLEASPLEGKYIARTALRNMLVGLGPQTMISAISQAFDYDYHEVRRAYNLLPELGMVAQAAMRRELGKICIQPSRPVRPMIIRPGEAVIPGAFQPKHPGLRVQLHRAKGETFVFTSQQKNITSALNGLYQELGDMTEDLVIDADLIGLQEGRVLSQAEMVRYINRRRLSRRSSVSPALLAYDLIYLQGEDLTGLAYEERRRRLLKALGEPKEFPFKGISPIEEKVLSDREEVKGYCHEALKAGFKGLITRDPKGTYHPGCNSSQDFIIGEGETVAVAVMRAEYGRRKKEKLLTRYRVALRSGDDLVPVGWVSSGLKILETKALSDHLQTLALDQDEVGVDVLPQVVLALKISGARCSKEGYLLIRPRIQEMKFDAAPEEVDDLERLEKICRG